jgi:hypothetical protein
MATSPGPRGGSSVLEIAKNRFPFKSRCQRKLSLPSFNEILMQNGITNEELNNQLLEIINQSNCN